MRRLLGCLVALGAAVLVPGGTSAAASWTRIGSAHFQFVGNADEKAIRRVASQLEQFRRTLMRAFRSGASADPVQTVVVVFDSDRSFTPFKPRFEGRTVKVGGYVVTSDRLNYIAVTADGPEDDYRAVFHEYTHFVVGNMAGTLPLWLDEGLAQYYETFEWYEGSKNVLVGRPTREDLDTLRFDDFIPIAELTAVTRGSAAYNTGRRRAAFYAESWGLVHYLLSDPARAGQFAAYVSKLRAGAPLMTAFTDAFGTDVAALEAGLKLYVGRRLFPARRFTFDDDPRDAGVGVAIPLRDVEAQAHLWEMLAVAGRVEEATPRLQQLAEVDPPNARALTALGLLELDAGRLDLAEPMLARAAQAAPNDAWTQASWGQALLARVRTLRADPAAHRRALTTARDVLERAATLSVPSVSTRVNQALAEIEEGRNLEHARALLDEAVDRAPAREAYQLITAQLMIRQRRLDDATALLERLATRGLTPETRQGAETLLRFIPQLRAQTERRSLFVTEIDLPPIAPPGLGTRAPLH